MLSMDQELMGGNISKQERRAFKCFPGSVPEPQLRNLPVFDRVLLFLDGQTQQRNGYVPGTVLLLAGA
jgi:hypothetical protein